MDNWIQDLKEDDRFHLYKRVIYASISKEPRFQRLCTFPTCCWTRTRRGGLLTNVIQPIGLRL